MAIFNKILKKHTTKAQGLSMLNLQKMMDIFRTIDKN